MNLQEPKVEFVPIEVNVLTQQSSQCPDAASQSVTGGGQRCTGTQEDSKTCPDFETLTPW